MSSGREIEMDGLSREEYDEAARADHLRRQGEWLKERKYKYTFLVQGITPEEAMKTEVHFTWGQEWREKVTNAHETRAGTAVTFETFADFAQYDSPIKASVGIRLSTGKPEVDLELEKDNDRWNRPAGETP